MLNFIKSLTVILLGIAASLIIIRANPPENTATNNTKAVATTTEIAITEVDLRPEIQVDDTDNTINDTEIEIESPKIMVETDPEAKVEELKETANSGILDLITIPPVQITNQSISEINEETRKALVNIICTTRQGGLLQPITGSGIIIDQRGVILTNAHIAQYFLLRNYIAQDFLNCIIRIGSPAVNAYEAEILFISSSWIKDNHQKIVLSNPKGTGENDFALLLITKTTNPNVNLPEKFPFISPDVNGIRPKVGESVVVAGYPAGFLTGIAIQKDLYAVSTVTQVKDIFTFENNTLDLFSIGGNIAAQKGSSGGGVVSTDLRLLGIVVTASDAAQTDDRDLRAITLFHINESIKKDTGVDFNNYLFGNLFAKSIQFREIVAPGLTALLESALAN